MPTKKPKVGKKRKQQGSGLFDSIKKAILSAASFAKKHKLISRGSSALGALGVPYMSGVSKVSGTLGYGMKRKVKGKGLLTAGERYKKGSGMKKTMPKRKTALRVKHSFP